MCTHGCTTRGKDTKIVKHGINTLRKNLTLRINTPSLLVRVVRLPQVKEIEQLRTEKGKEWGREHMSP